MAEQLAERSTQTGGTNDTIRNLRIHFYGVQGSGSVFPSRAEREAFQELSDYELLRQVFNDLSERCDGDGHLPCTFDELLGGPPDRRNLLAYRARFHTPELRVYGGLTTCVWVETADGHDLVFDCGSGFRNCAKDLQAKWGARPEREERDVHIFGSHSHFDHTEGFDQAALCFDPRNTLRVYGNRQFLRALDGNLGIFSRRVAADVRGVHTPLFYAIMPAKFEATEIRDLSAQPPPPDGDDMARHFHDLGEPVRLGGTSVRAFEVFHPAPCLAYRVEHGGRAFVFCTDHELRHGPDESHPHEAASRDAERRLVEHAAGADLLYRDGQYFRAEYDGVQGVGTSGAVPRVDWGHSCIEDVVDMACACGVKQTFIGHHDPNREWSERNWVDEALIRSCKGTGCAIELARAEAVVDL